MGLSDQENSEYVDIQSLIPDESDSGTYKEFGLKQISFLSDFTSCWIIIGDFVYDMTEYLEEHPGGMEIMLEFAGTDATSAFLRKVTPKLQ